MVHRNSGNAYQRVEVKSVTVPLMIAMSDLRQLFFETAGELVQKLNDEAMQLEKVAGRRRDGAQPAPYCAYAEG
jgi:hypothetical protein